MQHGTLSQQEWRSQVIELDECQSINALPVGIITLCQLCTEQGPDLALTQTYIP